MSKRNCISFADKVKVLEEVDRGVKKVDIATKYGIAPSTITLIIKNRAKISNIDVLSSRKRVRTCSYEDVNEAILRWFEAARSNNLPLSGNLIREKALQFAKELNCPDFQASNGWLESWKTRNQVVYKTISGESSSVNQGDCDVWIENVLNKILQKFEPKDIFNCDETGLFFKCLPSKTLAFKGDKCFGVKTSKERVTLLAGANMDGTEKLKLLLIGKSKNPRCLRGLKSLGLEYTHNNKAWMTGEIFGNWIKAIDKEMKAQKRKIVMFVDNCPAHPPAIGKTLKNVELVFFPPNATAKLQPMDQGIIKNIKVHYRKRIIRKIFASMENNPQLNTLITLRDCINEITKVWSGDVTKKTIENCFAKAGFKTNDRSDEWEEDDEIDLASLRKQWDYMQNSGNVDANFSLQEFIHIDDDVITSEHPTDQQILESLKYVGEDDDVAENEDECAIEPTTEQIRNALDIVRSALQFKDNVPDRVFNAFNRLETLFDGEIYYNANIQKKITDYFVKKS